MPFKHICDYGIHYPKIKWQWRWPFISYVCIRCGKPINEDGDEWIVVKD